MAVSALKQDVRTLDRLAPLRGWLQGSWALLFSHADDFACRGFESDRWVLLVRQSFATAGIRPLALASHTSGHDTSWVVEAGGCAIHVPVEVLQLRARADTSEQTRLAERRNPGARFVMILDESLRPRRTFTYRTQARLPSPIDLAGMAAALRRRGARD